MPESTTYAYIVDVIPAHTAPSIESRAIASAWRSLMDRVAQQPDLDMATLRDMAEAAARLAAEPEWVTYSETDADGVAALWCIPPAPAKQQAIIYLHGGGYNNQSKDTSRKLAGHLARAVGASALTIDYRLAPENPWPAALHDVLRVVHHLGRQQPKMTVLLCGESAGGSLAISTALALRDAHAPQVAGVIAFSPYVDLLGEDPAFADPASQDLFLSREMAELAAGMLLGETPAADPVVNLCHADPRDLPPLFLSAGGLENLATPIRNFAVRARAAGVAVEMLTSPNMQHAYVYMAGRAPEADATITTAGTWARHRLAELPTLVSDGGDADG